MLMIFFSLKYAPSSSAKLLVLHFLSSLCDTHQRHQRKKRKFRHAEENYYFSKSSHLLDWICADTLPLFHRWHGERVRGRRGVWDAVEKLRIYIIGSEVDDEYQTVVALALLIRQSTMKANTRKFSCSVCASWTRLFTSTHLSTRLQTAVANESRLGAHKFKQVLRKLHACHDNKTNCDDLWRRSQERKETRFLWLDNICVEADLKKERETEKLTLREKKRY